jgi:hypothetical protein
MTDNYSLFMEAISQLGLTKSQLEATSNLYKIIANRPKINGENMGDIINDVNERMDTYATYLSSQPHTREEFFSKINKKWQELRDKYNLKVPEDNWFDVDLHSLTWIPRIKDFASAGVYSDAEKRYDSDAQAKAWLNMMFDRRRKDRSDFRKYLQWERDCLRMKFPSRGAGISAYENDPEIKAALKNGGIAELIGKYCLQKAMMHPFMVGIEEADNPETKRKYADLSNRMAYIEDIKFNGKIPSDYISGPDELWFGWHHIPGGKRAFTKKRFSRFDDMYSKAPPTQNFTY